MRRGSALLLLMLTVPLGCWASFPDQPGSDGETSGPTDLIGATEDTGGAASTGESKVGAKDNSVAAAPPSSPPKADAPTVTTPPPPSCPDKDGDHWTTCAGDCDDSDGKAHPDQKGFFAAPTASGSFDYNCDGQQELEHTMLLGCGTSGNCGGKGWAQAVPACGASGQWAECASSNSGKGKDGDDEGTPPSCQLKLLGAQQQRCR